MTKAIWGVWLVTIFASPAFAAVSLPAATGGDSRIVRVEGGCGRDEHRDPAGYCRPDRREERREERPVCERGYHLGEDGRRCFPNR